LIELEMLVLEEMNREQLIAVLLEARDWLSLEFTREWLAEQSTDGLRLFMLAAKLVRVLRQNHSREMGPDWLIAELTPEQRQELKRRLR
jgi:hypothetical protein